MSGAFDRGFETVAHERSVIGDDDGFGGGSRCHKCSRKHAAASLQTVTGSRYNPKITPQV
jgi:hypothetical protein